jgi:hypothetical protein
MKDATSGRPGRLLIEIRLGIQIENVWKLLNKEMIA